jgi:diguanylate cyclase (GGDEF)-like protein
MKKNFMLMRVVTAPLKALKWLAFGSPQFSEQEEYLEFRYKFLIVLMLTGAVLTLLFIVGTLSQINPIGWAHGRMMLVFTAGTFVLWFFLRGSPKRFKLVGWSYEILSLLEASSSLIYVSIDELRILWFYTNVPCVFILLGQRAGWFATGLTIVGFLAINEHLERPYSTNGVATGVLALVYFGVSFHAYVDRSISYFKRMRDYNAQLHDLASHDPLTGVFNAGAYYRACDQQIHASQRANQPFAVLFVDLDHFKSINDTYGHAVGDDVLRAVAQTLKDTVRRSDIVGRIGGEEFSVFLPNTEVAGATQLAEALRLAIEHIHIEVNGQRLRITASIGVAARQFGQESMQAIQQHADQAMYEAKRAGRNRVSTFGSGPPGLAISSA